RRATRQRNAAGRAMPGAAHSPGGGFGLTFLLRNSVKAASYPKPQVSSTMQRVWYGPPGALAMVFMLATPRSASAIDVLQQGGLTLTLGVEAGIGGLLTENTNFGFGRFDLRSGEVTGDATWGEGYLEPSLSLDYDADGAGVFYGGVSGVGSLTVGD